MDIINCINSLINTNCNTSIFGCLKKCLNEIKCKLIELHFDLIELYCSYCHINDLIKDSPCVKLCSDNLQMFKSGISELTRILKSAKCEYNTIESQIKCVKSKMDEIKKIVESIKVNNGTLTFKIKSEKKVTAYIVKANGKKEQIECLIQQLKCLSEKLCSEFVNIEDTTTKLKHSLVFNHYYFQISSYILEQLHCIESQQKTLCEKLTNLKEVDSGISVISNNINYVKSMIEKMNDRREDLSYIRDSLRSIIHKLCKIKESANRIMTQIPNIQGVIDALKKVRDSIQNLKVIDTEQKCALIFECKDGRLLKYTLICIKDKLNINSITSKLQILENGIYSLECVICHINKLLGYVDTMENILSIVEYFLNIY